MQTIHLIGGGTALTLLLRMMFGLVNVKNKEVMKFEGEYIKKIESDKD